MRYSKEYPVPSGRWRYFAWNWSCGTRPARGVLRLAEGHAELHGQLRFAGRGVMPERQVDDVVAGFCWVPLALVLEGALVEDRVAHLGIGGQAELAGVGVPAPPRIGPRVAHVHHRAGVVDIRADVKRVGIVHDGELRVHRAARGLDHEHLDLAGEIPVVELAVNDHLARRGHGVELLMPAAAVVVSLGVGAGREGESGQEQSPSSHTGGS